MKHLGILCSLGIVLGLQVGVPYSVPQVWAFTLAQKSQIPSQFSPDSDYLVLYRPTGGKRVRTPKGEEKRTELEIGYKFINRREGDELFAPTGVLEIHFMDKNGDTVAKDRVAFMDLKFQTEYYGFVWVSEGDWNQIKGAVIHQPSKIEEEVLGLTKALAEPSPIHPPTETQPKIQKESAAPPKSTSQPFLQEKTIETAPEKKDQDKLASPATNFESGPTEKAEREVTVSPPPPWNPDKDNQAKMRTEIGGVTNEEVKGTLEVLDKQKPTPTDLPPKAS